MPKGQMSDYTEELQKKRYVYRFEANSTSMCPLLRCDWTVEDQKREVFIV